MANRINRKWRKVAEENERVIEEYKVKLQAARDQAQTFFNERYDQGYERATKDMQARLQDFATTLPPEPASLIEKSIKVLND